MSRTPQELRAIRISGNSIISVILEMQRYISAYEELYDDQLGNDGVLTDGVVQILQGCRILLLGEIGPALDAGQLDDLILSTALRAGIDVSRW